MIVIPSYAAYSDTSDGFIKSTNASYTTARAGSNLVVNDTDATSSFAVGQYKEGDTYDIRQGFLSFDTGFTAEDETVTSAEIRIHHTSNNGSGHRVEVREHDWGVNLGTESFVAGADLGTKPLLATLERPSAQAAGNRSYMSTAAFASAINTAGSTRVVINVAEQRLGSQPL